MGFEFEELGRLSNSLSLLCFGVLLKSVCLFCFWKGIRTDKQFVPVVSLEFLSIYIFSLSRDNQYNMSLKV
jgi:hypothetical protein